MTARATIPLTELVLLAAWLGAALLFAVVVAPAAFAALPTRTLAGALVGRVLPTLFYTGMAIGAAVFLLDALARTGAWRRASAGAAIAVACAVAQLIVGGRIERIRTEIAGPIDALAVDDARRVAFGRLHAFSVGWLALAILAALIALALAIRALHARG